MLLRVLLYSSSCEDMCIAKQDEVQVLWLGSGRAGLRFGPVEDTVLHAVMQASSEEPHRSPQMH